MHSSLIGKVEKANRYARELDRITIDRLSLTFRGDNDTHHVALDAGQSRVVLNGALHRVQLGPYSDDDAANSDRNRLRERLALNAVLVRRVD